MYKEELPIKKKLLMEFCANCQSTTCEGCLISDLFFALKNAAQQGVQADVCPTCGGAKFVIDWSKKTQSVCPDCSGNRR